MDADIVTLWQQLQANEVTRAIAVAIIVSYIANFVKPYLPTGKLKVKRTPDGVPVEPIENRWLPLVVFLANIVANPLVALYFNVTTGKSQDLLLSALCGAMAGGAAVGVARGFKLTMFGDTTEARNVAQKQIIKTQDAILALPSTPPVSTS